MNLQGSEKSPARVLWLRGSVAILRAEVDVLHVYTVPTYTHDYRYCPAAHLGSTHRPRGPLIPILTVPITHRQLTLAVLNQGPVRPVATYVVKQPLKPPTCNSAQWSRD